MRTCRVLISSDKHTSPLSVVILLLNRISMLAEVTNNICQIKYEIHSNKHTYVHTVYATGW